MCFVDADRNVGGDDIVSVHSYRTSCDALCEDTVTAMLDIQVPFTCREFCDVTSFMTSRLTCPSKMSCTCFYR